MCNLMLLLKNLSFSKITTEDPIQTISEIYMYVQFSSAVINLTIFSLIFIIFLNYIHSIFFKNLNYTFKILKLLNLFLIFSIISLLILKFYFSLKLEQSVGPYLYDIKYNFFINQNITIDSEYFIVFSSSFSDSIIILSFITGLICIELLGLKNLFKSVTNMNLFYIFNLFVTIMVSTSNILIMFLSFECIFLPTMYFVFKLGYSKKIEKSNEILFYWTLCGSFLILCTLGYLFYNFNTLNYVFLQNKSISDTESKIIFIIFLLGFGVKIPLAPFHYWLLRVHVDSPTAFSIFLSGFLVKSALYCLFILLSLFNNLQSYFILTGWIFFSLIVSTIGLAEQTDIKKLIAWATIQEMTFMMVFLIFKQMFLIHTCILFIVLHGLMSSYMFYIVDMLQRRFKTRALVCITGVHLLLPKISKHIWFLILLFSGFPLTAKFFIEWSLICIMLETNFTVLIFIILFINFLGAIFFCKIMFSILYGVQQEEDLEFVETQKKEYGLLNFLSCLIFILLWLIFLF